MLYPSTITFDFYIQATSIEEAESRIKEIAENIPSLFPGWDYPDVEQVESSHWGTFDPSNFECYDNDEEERLDYQSSFPC